VVGGSVTVVGASVTAGACSVTVVEPEPESEPESEEPSEVEESGVLVADGLDESEEESVGVESALLQPASSTTRPVAATRAPRRGFTSRTTPRAPDGRVPDPLHSLLT
jgi:hypothetical protein